jgi:SEC-C motif-containing protein
MAKSKPVENCSCGLPASYPACCGRYISGQATAPNAETLMRSRYTAYTLENDQYIQNTWHPRSRQVVKFDRQEACKWMGLKVIAFQEDGQKATVEFVASYKVNGKAHKLHEISKFEFEDGQWFYVDGTFPN